MSETPVAVIDIGSNSARIVVYRLEGGAQTQILAASRRSLRLVRELDKNNRLSAQALERTWAALEDFRAIALGAGASRIVALATSAVRDADNGKAFLAEVRKKLGFDVRMLSGEEEARLGFLGAVGGLPVEHGALFDVGGGSMQVTRFRQRRIMTTISVPLGSLRLSDAFLKSDPPTGGEVRRLCDHVQEVLEKAGVSPLEAGETLVGTGGTIRNLAKIERRTRQYPVTRLHGYVLTRKRLRAVVEEIAATKLKKRDEIPGLNDDRGDSIVGGGFAIRTLVDVLGAEEIWVSGQGVREGLARGLVSEELPAPAVVRASSLRALARRFGSWHEERAQRRATFADALLAALHLQADQELREALLHAATVLDVGVSVDFFDRHQHVADILVATDLIGFTHRQVALVSAIARGAGDEDSEAKSYAPLLSAEDAAPVGRAATLLALADDIEERCPPGSDLTLTCDVLKDEVVVTVPALAGWRPRTIGRRFERAFGRKLTVKSGAK